MGTNAFEIVVKAQNGAEKVYKLTVNVIDENPIEVTIDNKKYTVVRKNDVKEFENLTKKMLSIAMNFQMVFRTMLF